MVDGKLSYLQQILFVSNRIDEFINSRVQDRSSDILVYHNIKLDLIPIAIN